MYYESRGGVQGVGPDEARSPSLPTHLTPALEPPSSEETLVLQEGKVETWGWIPGEK